MTTIAALRRLKTSNGLLRVRRTVATAIAGSQRGVASASAAASACASAGSTTSFGWNSNDNPMNTSIQSFSEFNGNNSIRFVHRRQFHRSAAVFDYPDHIVVPFPALSPTMEVGTIAKWEIAEGDEFTAGSVIASIETDKATMDFEAQDDGILAKILKDGPDAADLPVGTPIAIVVEEPEDVAAFADYVVSEEESTGVAGASIPARDRKSVV